MTLWDYALAAWDRPGVRDACLALQDQYDQCVPLLLWRAWAAVEGRPIDGGRVDAAVAVARPWEREIIAPLRTARRALGKAFEGLDGGTVQHLRQAVRAGELDAERALLEALGGLAPPPSGAQDLLVEKLADLMEAWNGRKGPDGARDLAVSLA